MPLKQSYASADSTRRSQLRYRRLVWFGCLLLSALPTLAQIRGGAEAVPFTPGDHVILDEDYTSIPLGGQVPGWEILKGNYEVAEFQGQRWLRPLAFATQLVRRVQIPEEFSLEFTTFLFPEAGPVLRVFLATEEDLTYEYGFGPDGPAHVTLGFSAATIPTTMVSGPGAACRERGRCMNSSPKARTNSRPTNRIGLL